MDFAEPTAGNEISEPFTGNVQFNKVSASANGLPNSLHTRLAAGTPVTIPVTITNTGAAPEFYFVDPRLNTTTTLSLATQFGTSETGLALPLAVSDHRASSPL